MKNRINWDRLDDYEVVAAIDRRASKRAKTNKLNKRNHRDYA